MNSATPAVLHDLAPSGTLLAAINEIDHVAAGTIQVTEYGTARPRFPVFASVAAICFAVGALSKLGLPYFQRYP